MLENTDLINTIFPIATILIWFILSVATYLTSTWMPKINETTLLEKIVKKDILTDIGDILDKKIYLANRLKSIYWSIPIILAIFCIFTLLWLNVKSIEWILIILLFYFAVLFAYLAYKIMELITITISIDHQLLEIEIQIPEEEPIERSSNKAVITMEKKPKKKVV